MCNIGTSVRLCFGVSCDICAGVIVIRRDCVRDHVVSAVTSWPSLAVVPGRGVPWLRRAWVLSLTSLRSMYASPSCGCDTPTNASVCNGFGVVYITRFALHL